MESKGIEGNHSNPVKLSGIEGNHSNQGEIKWYYSNKVKSSEIRWNQVKTGEIKGIIQIRSNQVILLE